MTSPEQPSAGPADAGPPAVDDPRVAAALAEIADLEQQPLAEHHDRLARAHEVLHEVLHGDPSAG